MWHAAIWEAVTAGVIALILGILYGAFAGYQSPFHQRTRMHIDALVLPQELWGMWSTPYRSCSLA